MPHQRERINRLIGKGKFDLVVHITTNPVHKAAVLKRIAASGHEQIARRYRDELSIEIDLPFLSHEEEEEYKKISSSYLTLPWQQGTAEYLEHVVWVDNLAALGEMESFFFEAKDSNHFIYGACKGDGDCNDDYSCLHIVAIDSEWPCSWYKSDVNLSIIQLALADRVFVVDLQTLPLEASRAFCGRLLSDTRIIKLGFAVSNDIAKIKQFLGLTIETVGLVELKNLGRKTDI